ncbi:MAG: hypothetical protein ACE5EC_06285, partial [Phycisphaerae bacterium]
MTKQMRGRSLAIACCCALVGVMGIANTAHATVFLNETFTYPDGNLVPNGNWTAHSQAGNGPIQVVGGQIVVTHPTGSEDVNTTFGVTQGPGQTFYAGFDLVNTGGAANVYFAHWRPSINFEFRSRVFITAHAGGDFTLAIGNESNTTQFVVSPDPMFFGINYRVVNSYDFNTGDSDLYVNGLLVAHFAGLTGGGPGMDHDQEPMDTYAFRQSNGDSTQTIDNLILADTLLEANGGPLPELGSCCDTVNNTCIDNITQPSCLAPGVWTLNGTCALNCDLTGSCCDETFMLPCTDNVLEVNCAPPLVWTEQGTCAANCVPGACCDAVGTCTPNLTKGNCEAVGGIFLGPNTDCTGGCPDFSQVMINEIRSGQPDADTDEYFELVGPSGFPLGGLTYLVIGDGTGGSGVIEEAIDLSGQAIPADGHFLAADSTTFTLAPIVDIDLDTALNFEDSDNVTHLLVAGFSGAIGDDLDGNDDCVLDSTPWVSESDRVALVEEANPPLATECHYGTTPDNTIQDIATGFAPGHVLRLPDAGLPWLIGDFNPFFGDDTPGVVNALGTGACCSSDPMGGPNDLICTITDRATCETVLLGVYKGRDVTCLEVG